MAMTAPSRLLLALVVIHSSLSLCSCSNLVQQISSNANYSILYKALVQSEERDALEGRTHTNGSAFVFFAPTDDSFADFTQEEVECMTSPVNFRNLFSQLLRYFQVTTVKRQVNNVQDLAAVAVDKKLWTVLGQPINVDVSGGMVILTNEDGSDQTTVSQAMITETNVTLVVLDTGVLLSSQVRSQIMMTCFPPPESAPPSSMPVPYPY